MEAEWTEGGGVRFIMRTFLTLIKHPAEKDIRARVCFSQFVV